MIQSYRASEPPADKPKQEEDLQIPPLRLGEVSHEGENKEAGEEIISLDTDRKIRGRGLVLKSRAPMLLFSAASASHDGEISATDHQKANQYNFWRFLSKKGLIDWFFWKTVLRFHKEGHMLNLFYKAAAALGSYHKSVVMIKDCSKEHECERKKRNTQEVQQLHLKNSFYKVRYFFHV